MITLFPIRRSTQSGCARSGPRVSDRAGATLTEVLMAILVMSVGVVSVITLFPLAILRAVKATQMTNAKLLEENVRNVVRANPWLLANTPVRDRDVRGARVVDPLGLLYGSPTPLGTIPRISPLPASWTVQNKEAVLSSMFALPDSYTTIYNDVVSGGITSTATSSTMTIVGEPLGVDLSTAGDLGIRVTVLSADGTQSRTFPTFYSSVAVNGNSITVSPALPGSMNDPSEIERVVVEIAERRYSWMLTCSGRQAGGLSDVRCAVFFRRSFDALEEQHYALSGTSNKGSSVVTGLTWGAGTTPILRPGGFVFDADNGYWYEIAEVIPVNATSANLQLTGELRADLTKLMVPTGLVHLFNLTFQPGDSL